MVENKINLAKTASEAAVLLSHLGFVPIRVNGKVPVEEGWQKTHYENDAAIAEKFKGWKGNVGVLCDGFVLYGPNTKEAYEALKAEIPFYDETLCRMGNNPYPCAIFKRADTEAFWKGQKIQTNDESLRTMADIWGDGSQFVAWGTHPAGVPYQFVNDNPILPISSSEARAICERTIVRMGPAFRLKTQSKKGEEATQKQRDENNIFALVKKKVRMSDVLGTNETRVMCPLHKQGSSNPAAQIYENPTGDTIYCHSSGCFGDVITIYAKLHNLKPLEAAQEMAKLWGIDCSSWENPKMAGENHLPQNAPNSLGQISTDVKGTLPLNAPTKSGQNPEKVGDFAPAPIVIGAKSTTGSACGKKPVAYAFGAIPKELLTPPEWHLSNLIPKNGKVFIGAPVANYKSTVAIYLAAYLAAGAPIWNEQKSAPIRVFYLDEEDTWGHITQVIAAVRAVMKPEEQALLDQNFFVASAQSLNSDRRQEFFELVRGIKPEVVFIDSFRKFTSGDENESEIINEIDSNVFNPLSVEFGLTWVLIHHNTKRQSTDRRSADDIELMRGSGAIGGVATLIIMLEKLKDDSFAFYVGKNKWGRSSAQLLYMERGEGTINIEGGEELEVGLAAAGKLAARIREWILKEGKFENIRTSDIKAQFTDTGNTIDSAIQILKKQGDLVGTGKDNRSPFKFVSKTGGTPAPKGQAKISDELEDEEEDGGNYATD